MHIMIERDSNINYYIQCLYGPTMTYRIIQTIAFEFPINKKNNDADN